MERQNLGIVVISNGEEDAVNSTIESVKIFAAAEEKQIVVVNNKSEGITAYAESLNEAKKQFGEERDLLVLFPGTMVLPGCIDALYEALDENGEIGAVCAKIISASQEEGKSYSDAAEHAFLNSGAASKREVLVLPEEAILIRREMLNQIGAFDSRLTLPESVMVDFSFRGLLGDYHYYEIQNAFMYKVIDCGKKYVDNFGETVDRSILKEKWGMNYFNNRFNSGLLNLVKKTKEEAFSVLEIGCDCGVNLLELKNQYPNVRLYGVEINASAAKIASHIAQVEIANIEEKSIGFSEVKFDYIIFGDVLEHLRDPDGTLRYCKGLLKEGGRVLACVPNLMHYSVMRELLNGKFSYADTGLLDRTHIHFFTYYELVKLFVSNGYELENILGVGYTNSISEEDRKFVHCLLSLSENTKEIMYYAYQYIVSAKYKSEEDTL